jgi:tetratricopeptide (TPR) repeat protein
MSTNHSRRLYQLGACILSILITLGCNRAQGDPKPAASSADSKLPITTSSEEARREFLQGRELADKLLAQDSLQHFDKAIALDPQFASAELARANSSPTAKDFFAHLNKAVALADKASQGEALLIHANEAAANGDTTKQKEYLDKLAAGYPNDERVQFTLGAYYFGQQELPEAVEHYRKATELAPTYSSAFNLLGYSYRQQGDYAGAEQAFKKYIDLIPNDPNPYDSYAELLMREGKFDDSISQYRKALEVDSNFFPSHLGIAADLTYTGKSADALAELQKALGSARNDGERRGALFAASVVYADTGKLDKALQKIDEEYAVAEKLNDPAAKAADLQAKGNILLQMQRYDEAKQTFARSLQFTKDSNLSQEIKNNAETVHHYNLARIAIAQKNFKAGNDEMDQFRKNAESSKNAAQLKQVHELAGTLALAQKKYDDAIAELAQSNQQNPQNLYRLCQAYEGKSDASNAEQYCSKAAGFNSLPQLNYAFVRKQASETTLAMNRK